MVRFGGGLGDIFIFLYWHQLYNSLPLFQQLGRLDALVSCSNPAAQSVLESLRIFDYIEYRDWSVGNPMDEWEAEYIQPLAPGAISLYHAGVDAYPDLQQTSFDLGNMYHHKYHLSAQEELAFDRLQHLNYIVVHPSGGLQAVDGLSRVQYGHLVKKLLQEFPTYYVVAVGASHSRVWVEDVKGCYVESDLEVEDERFIDMTNKASGALSANIVENGSAFVGTHSAWINMFWFFRKPTVCVYSYGSHWGDWKGYQLTNGCNWGFYLPWSKAVPVKADDQFGQIGDLVVEYLRGFFKYGGLDELKV